MIDKLIFGKGVGPVGGPSPTRKVDSKAKAEKGPSDKVDFSSVLQGVNKANEASEAQSTQRAQKVAALKAQVASGSYRPDLERVAESLIGFMAKEK